MGIPDRFTPFPKRRPAGPDPLEAILVAAAIVLSILVILPAEAMGPPPPWALPGAAPRSSALERASPRAPAGCPRYYRGRVLVHEIPREDGPTAALGCFYVVPEPKRIEP